MGLFLRVYGHGHMVALVCPALTVATLRSRRGVPLLLQSVTCPDSSDHGHARSQDEWRRNRHVEANFDRDALYHLHKVTRGVFRGQETKDGASPGTEALNRTGKHLVRIGIDMQGGFLPSTHVAQLRLLKIGLNPDVMQGQHREDRTSNLYDLAHLQMLPGNHPRHRGT